MSGPCLCGATDCPRCYPGSWWHNEDCDGDDCVCDDPHDYDVDDYEGDE